MVRLFSFLSALVVASAVLWLSIYGAERLMLMIQSHAHSRWFGTSVHLFTFFPIAVGSAVAIILGLKEQRAKKDEDVRLTPLVRRLPSGFRKL